jgi:hypothetical protein
MLSIFVLRCWHHGYQAFELMELARMQVLLTVRRLALVPNSPMVEKACPWLDLPVLITTLREKGIYNPSSFGEWLFDEVKHPQSVAGGVVQIRPTGSVRDRRYGMGDYPDSKYSC